jgi:hypothetical protein
LQIKELGVKTPQKRTPNEPGFGVDGPKKRPNEGKKGGTKLNLGLERRGTGNADLGHYAPAKSLYFLLGER